MLQALQSCTKLWRLDISNTNVNSFLEYLPYLPQSLEKFNYDLLEDSNFKVKEIANELKWFESFYKFKEIKELIPEIELLKLIKSQYSSLASFQNELNKHKAFFGNNNELSDLLRRWQRANLNLLTVNQLKSEIKLLEERKLTGENIQVELNEKIKQLKIEVKRIELEKNNKLNEAAKELEDLKNSSKFSDEDKDSLKELILIHKEKIQAKYLEFIN